ncbi:MAG: hypothetical protein OXR73_26270 [Myxococcales bacterium]|nr:hypothetical protein [Myxococcales bacterium]
MAVPLAVLVFSSVVWTASAQDTPEAATATETAPPAADGEAMEAQPTAGGEAQALPAEAPDAASAAGAATSDSTASTNAAVEPAGVEGQTQTSAEQIDAGTYGVRLRDLEQRINELKEQIFRSKARLSLLAETVLQGVVAGAQARLVHVNKMGNSYKLVRVVYALDGAPIFNKADESGALSDREEFDVYNGSIVPGEHTLTVNLQYRGHGFGIFSYLKGYRFNVSSTHTFTATEGKLTNLRVVGFEKGGPTAPLEERPAVRFLERVDDATPGGGGEEEAAEGGE